jgi:IS30 family transposase
MTGQDFSTADIAAALGRDSQYVRREIWRGRLPCARRIVRDQKVSYRISLEELTAYLATYDRARMEVAVRILTDAA